MAVSRSHRRGREWPTPSNKKIRCRHHGPVLFIGAAPTHRKPRHRPAHQPPHLPQGPRGAPCLFSWRTLRARPLSGAPVCSGGLAHAAQRTNRWAGGFERRHLESKLKPAMQDAELEVAWVVLRGRNASTELPVRVRSSDMAPGCWKPVRRRLVVDLDARAWHLGVSGTFAAGRVWGLFSRSYTPFPLKTGPK